ncbi:uncharacterized protein L969DRAFT_87378 [Mixia osmundae IAM 14324]|uniref:uncharacterized protein n=1 Tax=Mixia osmundae (strain CBS 9802 / IAM 14324 / JCM 22182 / KY 12970) TaxID=764103 RepID=UPI0004A55481|nr:uncharacterized protein L969DRAFT_87378 [Mixia osmundae IAM 14324]KEI39421.1 hypothetical protein L969DRAFT_87378 [Mixia osmundae IAM 14324]
MRLDHAASISTSLALSIPPPRARLERSKRRQDSSRDDANEPLSPRRETEICQPRSTLMDEAIAVRQTLLRDFRLKLARSKARLIGGRARHGQELSNVRDLEARTMSKRTEILNTRERLKENDPSQLATLLLDWLAQLDEILMQCQQHAETLKGILRVDDDCLQSIDVHFATLHAAQAHLAALIANQHRQTTAAAALRPVRTRKCRSWTEFRAF